MRYDYDPRRSAQILDDLGFVCAAGANRGRYSNAELDGLIDRFFVTVPRAERMGVLTQIIRHMTDQLVIMGLYYTPDATGVSSRLRNVPTGDPWNAHEWDVR